MGLLDAILGNMMGAGGASMQGRGGASSPIVKALMMLLAAKAYQHYRSRPQDGSLNGGLGGMLGGQGGGLGGGMPGGLAVVSWAAWEACWAGWLVEAGSRGVGLVVCSTSSARTAMAITWIPGSARARTGGWLPTSSRRHSGRRPLANSSSRPDYRASSSCPNSRTSYRTRLISSHRTVACPPSRRCRRAGSRALYQSALVLMH